MTNGLEVRTLDLQNSTCQKCPLSVLRTRVLNGIGPLDARIMIVADSPTNEEDGSGRPFTGPVGRELDRLIAKWGFHRSQVYLTYINRCFGKLTPNGVFRPPTYEETLACMPYLEQEIATIRPNVIVALGNGALAPLLGQKKATISDYRGKEVWSEKYQLKLMPTYHPSMLLRSPNMEETMMQDFRRIFESAKYPELTKSVQGNYITIDTLEKFDAFYERIMQMDEVAADIETSGFNWQTDKLMCVSFSWTEGTGIVLPITKWVGLNKQVVELKDKKVRRKGIVEIKKIEVVSTQVEDTYHPWWGDKQAYVMEKLQSIMESNIKFIFQNGKFDYKFFLQLGWKLKPIVYDTLLMHYLLNETAKGTHGLKDMAIQYTKMGEYDKELEDWFNNNGMESSDSRNYARVPTELLFKYAATDADVTLQLKNIFKPLLEQQGMLDLFNKLIIPLNYTLTIAEFDGIKIDRQALNKAKMELQKELLDKEKKIREVIINEGITEEIDLDSPKQLAELFFTKLKLPVVKRTKKGAPSTDEEAMILLAKKHAVPMLLVEYRGIAKNLRTYVIGIEDRLDSNDRLHTKFLIEGTDTGRLSSQNPNLQNIPKKDKRIKGMFVVDEGNVLVEADEGQVEFRFWGIYSNDPQLVADLNAGLDIHRFMASLANKIPMEQVTDEQRQVAKSIVFGLMFNMGVDRLAHDHGVTMEYAQLVKDTFFGRYPIAKKWKYENVRRGKSQGFVQSIFGRVRHLPGINHSDNKVSYPDEQAAVNAPIQGAASDYTCNAANRILIRFNELGLHGKLRILVHDAIYMEIPKVELDQSMGIMKEEMERRILGIQVPMIAEFKVGIRWSELQKVKK